MRRCFKKKSSILFMSKICEEKYYVQGGMTRVQIAASMTLVPGTCNSPVFHQWHRNYSTR